MSSLCLAVGGHASSLCRVSGGAGQTHGPCKGNPPRPTATPPRRVMHIRGDLIGNGSRIASHHGGGAAGAAEFCHHGGAVGATGRSPLHAVVSRRSRLLKEGGLPARWRPGWPPSQVGHLVPSEKTPPPNHLTRWKRFLSAFWGTMLRLGRFLSRTRRGRLCLGKPKGALLSHPAAGPPPPGPRPAPGLIPTSRQTKFRAPPQRHQRRSPLDSWDAFPAAHARTCRNDLST